MSARCNCGRFARWDAYRANWWCERCERQVGPQPSTPDRSTRSVPVGRFLSSEALQERFLVVDAPGWPGGIEPWPNTLENAQRFVAENGGILQRRIESKWTEI